MVRSTTSLVLVDVLAKDKKTGEPIKDLEERDFVLKDNGKSVSITRFNRGKDRNLRPVQLWFVLACNEELHYPGGGGAGGQRRGGAKQQEKVDGTALEGSSFLAGKTAELRAALAHLDAQETAGVAHWCDNGQYDIDAAPSVDRDSTLNAVDAIAGLKPVVIEQERDKQSQEQATRLINNVARTAFPEPFVGLVMAEGKASDTSPSMPMATLPGLTDGSGTDAAQGATNAPVVPALYTASAEEYVKHLESFIDSLHSRYELGFEPEKGARKRHNISVTLTKSGRERFPGAILTYREAYSDAESASDAGASKNTLAWRQLDSRMQAAVKSREDPGQLSFEAQRTRDSQGQTEHYVLRIAPGALTWETLPNRDRRCVIMTVVAGFSAKGQLLRLIVKQLEVVQEFARLPEIAGKPVVVSLNAAVQKGAARVHLVVRDVASGRIGAQDLNAGPE